MDPGLLTGGAVLSSPGPAPAPLRPSRRDHASPVSSLDGPTGGGAVPCPHGRNQDRISPVGALMPPRFRVELSGELAQLASVSPHLQAPELQVEQDGDRVFLVSSTFDVMSSRDEVVGAAQRMVPLILGAMRLTGLRPTGELIANRVEEQTPDGPKSTTYAFAQAGFLTLTTFAPVILIGGQPPPPPPPIRVEIGLRDDRVALAMELFAREPSWSDLYKILDVIVDDLPGRKKAVLIQKGWATEPELRAFTGTANSYWAVGLHARHAFISRKAPKHQMSLGDAVDLIRRLLDLWLADKPGLTSDRALR